MAKVFLLVLLILLTHKDVLASDDIGYKHYLKGDYQKALKVWTQELNEGKERLCIILPAIFFWKRS